MPPRVRRLNDVAVFDFKSVARFVLRHQHFVQLFAGPDSDGLDLASRRNGFRKIYEPHAGNLGHENLAAMHLLEAADHETHPLLQRQPEARHPRIRDRNAAAAFLLLKNRNNAAPAPHHIAISRAAEP